MNETIKVLSQWTVKHDLLKRDMDLLGEKIAKLKRSCE